MTLRTFKLLLLLCALPLLAEAQSLSLRSELLLVEDQSEFDGQVAQLSSWEIQRGSLELNTREGFEHYRGTPWAIRVYLSEAGDVRLLYWIDDGDLKLSDDEDLLIEETWSALDFQARSFDFPPLADGSSLKLNLIPNPLAEEPGPIALDQQSFGLNFLCLKNSAVVVDDTYFIGSFTGFGEYLIAGVPGLAKVSMSFNAIRGWEPIGTYQDGVIEIEMDGGHWMTVLGVKYGPAGNDQGGPFTVFGSVDRSETTVEEARELVASKLTRDGVPKDRAQAVLAANAGNPYGGLGRGTIGSSAQFSEQLELAGGVFGKSFEECSH